MTAKPIDYQTPQPPARDRWWLSGALGLPLLALQVFWMYPGALLARIFVTGDDDPSDVSVGTRVELLLPMSWPSVLAVEIGAFGLRNNDRKRSQIALLLSLSGGMVAIFVLDKLILFPRF